ncbi:uncharacterized protein LOC144328932 [Podarcis muralis]
MASDGNQQSTTGSSLPAPSTSNDGAQTAVITCDPQTLNQFFRVFETLYRQCRPGSSALPALEPTQDVIPDTPPPIQGLSGSSAAPSAGAQQGPSAAGAQAPAPAAGVQPGVAASGRPGARAQSARSKKTTQATSKGKAPAKGKGKGKAPKKGSGGKTISQAIGTPSVFQEQQVHSSTEDSAGSGSEGETAENQPSCSATDASTSTPQGGKRKAKKKHTSAKKKRSRHSDTEEEESEPSRLRIWLVGHSIVHWAKFHALRTGLGGNLSLHPRVELVWIARRGMRWSEFKPVVMARAAAEGPPDALVIQLGENDLAYRKAIDLRWHIFDDLTELVIAYPHVTIIWSSLLERRTWRDCVSPVGVNKARKVLERAVGRRVADLGGFVIRHPSIQFSNEALYRRDGVHLSDAGNEVWLGDIIAGIRSWVQGFP